MVGEPDGEGVTATMSGVAIAAKDPPSALDDLSVGAVVAAQVSVANEVADAIAVWAGSEFELAGESVPIILVAVEEDFGSHGWAWEKLRVVKSAGYEKFYRGEVRGAG